MGFLARQIVRADSHGAVADAQLRRNLAKAGSLGTQPQYFIFADYSASTTKLLPASLRVPNTSTNALANEVTLQLSDSGNNCEKCLPQGAARINIFLVADELDTEGPKLLRCK